MNPASRNRSTTLTLSLIASAVAMALGNHSALAQEQAQTSQMENVQVIAKRVVKRNHVNTPAPKLVYDADFFQRFEPISVGDMLKRVPGVTFNSDVGEYDLPRLRGLDSRYTQVLINGRRMPGEENSGAIAVDRIPAEMVEKIEIIRSPSSDISSQGIGGSLNIILKDGARHEGGIWRVGAVNMKENRGSGFIGMSGVSDKIEYGFSINVQERYNPKSKVAGAQEGDEREEVKESDVRDSRDVALAADMAFQLSKDGKLRFNILHMDTQREEKEDTRVTALKRADSNSPFTVDEVVNESQLEDIDQSNTSFGMDYALKTSAGELNIYASSHQFKQDKNETNFEADFGDPLELDEREITDIDDTENRLGVNWKHQFSTVESKIGMEYVNKTRDFNVAVLDDDGNLDDENDEFADFEVDDQGLNLFASGSWALRDDLELELGLRAEYRDIEITGRDFNGNITRSSDDRIDYNPSAHIRWHMNEQDQFRASIARTLRRPQFDQLNPVELTIDDEKFRGNSDLDPESAVGIDLGYDHFIADSGVIGINFFYREVEDLIEYTQSDITVGGTDFELRQAINNRNTGKIMGVEFDFSAPMTLINAPSAQAFFNLTLLDSEVKDDYFEGLERRFSGQAKYVYNLGFEHELAALQASYGVSYQQQGDSEEFEGNEINRISYDGNLEIFIEKRFDNNNYALRLSGQNLLDAEKNELIRQYDDSAALSSGQYESTETEVENTSPAILLTLRGSF
ncbi:Colicin I receptor [Zhongshania aliphaticivorans]|uniref:Colicin I receptor n=1 Tax=Zhongshania aliphaticivorans TaxID=1470434 RepID=A0A5S9P6U0_9GAMM|nr:TonB-dependent receptor [Zhongshania aliphaticivorans]CAA0091743.1 Colicin I receptor [Zhongshania aliphaticivorans]CAA0099085.1 Colicin I receptor [Zhongshania aliphaticivorans]